MGSAFWYLIGLFFFTFVSEDAAVLSGGFAAAIGKIAWWDSFLACFLGVWTGDLGLYLLARYCGRPVISRFWKPSPKQSEKIARSEAWFEHHGFWALTICRIVPGTRVPTYLSAGYLRMPFGFYSLVTGCLALIWVTAIFLMIHQLGKAAPGVFQMLKGHMLWFAIGLVVILLLIHVLHKLALLVIHSRMMKRVFQWEFWPAWIFYFPIALNYLRLALFYRSLTLPSCANPGMFTGGLIGESKYATLHELAETSPEFVPPTYLIDEAGNRQALLKRIVSEGGLEYPFILKPDVGQRGSGFKVVKTEEEALAYLDAVDVPVVAQGYVPGPLEIGIFYYRFPHEEKGRILAMTEKIFPVITGDGRRSVEEIILADERATLLAETYFKRFEGHRQRILQVGEKLRLVEAGNHAQGCIFRDGMHLWSAEMEARIDDISKRIKGFSIGRYDVRYPSNQELVKGRGFMILELNGAASEATSAYDATKSLWDAYRLLFKQWDLVFAIGNEYRKCGARPDSIRTILSEWRNYQKLSQCHPHAD
jgi:membrane protein DedA with SNARE-associated domain